MDLTLQREVDALRAMRTGELLDRYARVFGEPARTRHKTYLIRRIAWRLQAQAEGDLSQRARERAVLLARNADVRVTPPRDAASPVPRPGTVVRVPVQTDPRLPSVGTVITRAYKGRTVRVQVLAGGFEYDGRRYDTLTAVALAVTGTHWNGFRFFGLGAKR
jgi:hypothetical protein